MKIGTTTHYTLCRHRHFESAACRKLARCSKCNRVLRFGERGFLCGECTRKTDKGAVKNGR